jgi:hypothetical protein
MHNQTAVEFILSAMQAAITKYQLEVLQRYPDDLLVHDKAMLERLAVPGARIAWMVGHCHTHLVALGFHPDENQHVSYLTNLANEDRFFVLSIGHSDHIQMKELDRQSFTGLSSTPVPYQRRGDASSFWLMRNNVKVGHVALAQLGNWQDRLINATLTPMAGISAHERAALGVWAGYAVTELAGSLFVRSVLNWAEQIEVVAQAA